MSDEAKRANAVHINAAPIPCTELGRRLRGVLTVAVATGVVLTASAVRASDTVETWDVGASDVDFYLGVDGLRSGAPGTFGDLMLGYGIRPRLSAYLGTRLHGDHATGRGETSVYLGVFGTIIESRHIDVDVFLNVANGGPNMASFELAPAMEINLDRDPDMDSWGVYLRSSLPVHSRMPPDPGVADEGEAAFHLASTLGTYRTIKPGHQVLLEFSVDYHPGASGDARTLDMGAVALGYNVVVASGLELITEASVDVPQADERPAIRVMAGFIATLPGGAGGGGE